MRLGVVSLVFRCRPLSGAAHPTEEATEVAWLDIAQITGRMAEAFAIRLTDALETGEPRIRIHDGRTCSLRAMGRTLPTPSYCQLGKLYRPGCYAA